MKMMRLSWAEPSEAKRGDADLTCVVLRHIQLLQYCNPTAGWPVCDAVW